MTSKPFNVLVVGAGEQSTESLIPSLLDLRDEGVKVTGLVDLDIELARLWADEFEIPDVRDDLDVALAELAADAVVLAVPHSAHYKLGRKVLAARKHLCLEKPFTDSARQARALIVLAKQNEVVLTPGYQYPVQLADVLTAVASGDFGEATHTTAKWLRRDGIPDRLSFADTPKGGVGPDLGSHVATVVLAGHASRPAFVVAHGSNVRGRARYGDAFVAYDTMNILIVFADGTTGLIQVSWCADVVEDVLLVERSGIDARLEIPMMAAELDKENFVPRVYAAVPGTDDRRVEVKHLTDMVPIPTEESFRHKLRNWVRACRGEESLTVTGQLALDVRLILDAANKSARSGGTRQTIAAS